MAKKALTLREENEALRTALKILTEGKGDAPPADKRKKWDPKWETTKKLCAHCGKEKYVVPDFGIRRPRGIEDPQSWCRQCRNDEHYYNRPRKNRSVNNP